MVVSLRLFTSMLSTPSVAGKIVILRFFIVAVFLCWKSFKSLHQIERGVERQNTHYLSWISPPFHGRKLCQCSAASWKGILQKLKNGRVGKVCTVVFNSIKICSDFNGFSRKLVKGGKIYDA